MNLSMPQALSSAGHTLYTLSNSHAQQASGPKKSWTHTSHTYQKSCSTCLRCCQVLDTPCAHSSQVMLKSVHTSIVHTGPKPEATPNARCQRYACAVVWSHEGIPQSSEGELAALGSTAVGPRRRHTYASIYLKFRNGWTKQYLIQEHTHSW